MLCANQFMPGAAQTVIAPDQGRPWAPVPKGRIHNAPPMHVGIGGYEDDRKSVRLSGSRATTQPHLRIERWRGVNAHPRLAQSRHRLLDLDQCLFLSAFARP